jgi:hypothetical protein
MFRAKIRETDQTIIDVDDSEPVNNLTVWTVRSSNLETFEAFRIPATLPDGSYSLSLLQPLPEDGTWELTRTSSEPNRDQESCYIIFADSSLTEPIPQEVSNFIAWVGEEEAKKLTSLGGDSISYIAIETALEQASIELGFMFSNLSPEQVLIYENQRQHLIRTIARYRLDRICPRAFVKADYDSLVANLAAVSRVTSGGVTLFSPSFDSQSCCPVRSTCGNLGTNFDSFRL